MAAAAPTRSDTWLVAAGALLAVGLGIGAFVLLRPFDAALADWARRPRAFAALPLAVLDHVLRFGLLAVVIAAAVATRDRTRALAGALAVIALGNLASEVLKTAIERARPSAATLAAGGNSLPSGHVMGCTVTVLVAIGLLRRVAWPRPTRLALAALALGAVAFEGMWRMVRGSHWASDVAVSLLLGIAWVLGARAVGPAGPRAVGASLAGLAAVYAVFYLFPGLRLRIPSP